MIRHSFLIVTAVLAVAALGLVLLAARWRAHDQARIEEVARETHAALCAFKQDLERRRLDTWRFREGNPQGIPGISPSDLNRSLAAQRATLNSLDDLDCL